VTASWRSAVADLERAASAGGRRGLGKFVLEGVRLHERATRAGLAIETAVCTAAFRDDRSPRVEALLAALEAGGCRLYVVGDDIVARLTGGRGLGAIIGLAPIPEAPALADALARSPLAPPAVLIAAGIEEPGNVGALARTALASGAAALVAVAPSDPWHPKAVRTSMGAAFRLPILAAQPDVHAAIVLARDAGLTVVAAISRGGVPLELSRLGAAPAAILIGGEAHGLSDAVLAACDLRVTIPMPVALDSLSVNAAAAVLLWEFRRLGFVSR